MATILILASVLLGLWYFNPIDPQTKQKVGFWQYVVGSGREVSINLIAALIASVSSVLYYKLVMRAHSEEEQSDLASRIARNIELKVLSGVRRIPEGLATDSLVELFRTSINTVVIETWIDEEKLLNLKEAFLEILDDPKRQLTIVLLHPNSPSASRRRRDMQYLGALGVRSKITSSLKALRQLRTESRKRCLRNNPGAPLREPNLKVYCHDCLPSIQLYQTPQIAYVGFYLQGVASSSGLQLEVEFPSKMGNFISKHVDDLLSPTNSHLLRIDLTIEDEAAFVAQFNLRHLDCQLDDIADQLVNMSPETLSHFVERLQDTIDNRDTTERRQRVINFLEIAASKMGYTLKRQQQRRANSP
ncbi:MAG: hypothetical protein NTV80_24710 [Verrucomicrobia bacterium]|nr:hypothetical protein [Verrucomicrobiota bacterium]